MLKISNVSKTFNIGTINEKKALRKDVYKRQPVEMIKNMWMKISADFVRLFIWIGKR